MLDFLKLKEELLRNLKRTYEKSQNPVITNLEEGIEWFQKACMYPCGIKKLDATRKSIFPAINDAIIERRNTENALKIIAEELEPYLKKVRYIVSGEDFSGNHSMSLAPMLENLGLSQVLANKGSRRYQDILNASKLDDYRGGDEFIEDICRSYIVRNDVHTSTDWDIVEYSQNLTSLLTIYVYATLKHIEAIKLHISQQTSVIEESISIQKFDEHSKMLYDFISFGNTTTEIKNQVINSFILHYLYQNTGATLATLIEESNKHFQARLTPGFYQRAVDRLIKLDKIDFNSVTSEYHLNKDEIKRLEKVIEDFSFREEMLLLEFDEILQKYGLSRAHQEIFDGLKSLLENNYNIDLLEILDAGVDIVDNISNCTSFLNCLELQLKSNGLGGDAKIDVLKDLISMCEQNDFLHKICISNIYSNATNQNQLENYLRQTQRVIYLDTQVLLYVLCCWYEKIDDTTINHYNIVHDLLKYVEGKEQIKLRTSNLYVREVAYHLREAITLIPFEEIGFLSDKYSSNNVFYQFYYYLKIENRLEDEIDSFEDFLGEYDVNYDDITNKDYFNEVTDLIKDYLESENIESIYMSINGTDKAFEAIKNSLTNLRREITIRNDAATMTFLSKTTEHVNEPIFATWDNSFINSRKKYFRDNRTVGHWHLFFPSKLLNHLNLLEFKIESESITNEFISILDSLDVNNNTNKLVDSLNYLLDIDKGNKRKYLKKVKEFSKKYVYNLNNTDVAEEKPLHEQPISQLIRHLTYNYNNWDHKYNVDDLKIIFDVEENFEIITQIFEEELVLFMRTESFSTDLIDKFDALISKSKGSRPPIEEK